MQAVQAHLEFARLKPPLPGADGLTLRVRPGELKPLGFQLATNKVISVAAARTIFVARKLP